MRYLLVLSVVTILLLPSCEDNGLQPDPDPVDPEQVRPLVVHVLDIGGGDANLIINGNSRVIIDGGPSPDRLAPYIDRYELNESRIKAVILSHTHDDHSSGLRELFRTDRNIEIGYFFDNVELEATSIDTEMLRDSARARAERGELVYRNASDPCGDGSAICTLKLDGEARVHVMRPHPGETIDNGSIPVKLVGPDSASFTMWLGGDARPSAIDWQSTRYLGSPGMRVNVLKGHEHGSCRALPQQLLDLTQPDWVTFSLDEMNANGRIHNQTKARLAENDTPWYRTDRNGTITITAPGTPRSGYTIAPEGGNARLDGLGDDHSDSPRCE